jgi:tetratricopeptide (TPR) repeat protein
MKSSIILLALLMISGCFRLVPSIQESQRFMSENAAIMSMANQGQFDEAVVAADNYINAYLNDKKYYEAMNLLVMQAGFSYQAGNYENIINSYDKVENVYKQTRLKYGGNKSTVYKASDAGTKFANYIGVYIDASIQLGEYDSILVVLDKGEKVLKASLSEMEDFFQSSIAPKTARKQQMSLL